jgi:rare lipoprotein A
MVQSMICNSKENGMSALKRTFLVAFIMTMLIGPMMSKASAFSQSGVGSYYGPKFHGKKTASGEKFNQNAMTAAHKTLPFGTRLKVTNLSNKRSVVVRVNDRGPFIRGRIVDVSTIAARQLGLVGRGVARVRIQKI